MTSAPTWNLDQIFPGGPRGEAFAQTLEATEAVAQDYIQETQDLPPLADQPGRWVQLLKALEALNSQVAELWIIAYCTACGNTDDSQAFRISARCSSLQTKIELARLPLIDGLVHADQQTWEMLRPRPEWAEFGAWIDNERANAHLRLPRQEEELVTALSEDGLGAWGRLYQRRAGRVRLHVDGPEGDLTPGQAWPLLHDNDAAVRARVHQAWTEAWREDRDLWASTLTHIFGQREVVQKRLGVDPLATPLARCRMERESLEAMFQAARQAQPLLNRFLSCKAELLGMTRLNWQDQWAPVAQAPAWSWEQARAFVEDNFGAWHPELQQFAQKAFSERWVEAEERNAKAGGAWCAGLPLSQQSRVFMTFGGTFSGAMTLAHELGHAFHNHVTRSLPRSQVHIPMTLAETASVFAENLVRDAALAAATDPADRLAMLDARLSAGMVFLLNIPARFQFECELHNLRKTGEFDPDELDERMVHCLRSAYGDHLGSWDETYWCSKAHFHMADRAFYNFPYTFGYLFSGLVYARAKAEGPGFQATYTELLRQTGTRDAESLAQNFLGLDLRRPETWWQAIAPLEDDLADFEATAAIVHGGTGR